MEVTAIRSYDSEKQTKGNGGKPRNLRLTFACDIHQVDGRTIEVELGELPYPVFTEEHIKTVHHEMGVIRGDQMLEDAANDMLRKRVLEGVR